MRAAVTARPDDAGARWNLAKFYLQTKQPDRATEQLEVMDRLQPKDPGAQAALAHAWLTVQRGDRAERLYRRLIQRFPKAGAGWQGLAVSLFQQQRFYEAGEAASRAIRLEPGDPANHFLLASAALEYARQFPNTSTHLDALGIAETEFQRVAKVWPNNPDVHYRLGLASAGRGDESTAIRSFLRALSLSPRPDIYLETAHAYRAASDLVNAQKTVEDGLAHFADDAALREMRGEMLQASAQPGAADRALTEFETAARQRPDDPDFQERLGIADLRTNRLNEARAAFETELRLRPYRPVPYKQLALVYTRLRDPQRALDAERKAGQIGAASQELRHLQELSQAKPGDVPLHLRLAERYAGLGLTGPARDERLLAQRLTVGSSAARKGLAAPKARN